MSRAVFEWGNNRVIIPYIRQYWFDELACTFYIDLGDGRKAEWDVETVEEGKQILIDLGLQIEIYYSPFAYPYGWGSAQLFAQGSIP